MSSSRKTAGPRGGGGGGAAAAGKKKVGSGPSRVALERLREGIARRAEEEERRAEEERRRREEERRRKRKEEKVREEARRREEQRRRLGITVVADAPGGGGDGDRRWPVYDSRKTKLQAKPHGDAQSEGDMGELLSSKPQLEEEQINALSIEGYTVVDAVELGEERKTGSSEEDVTVSDDDDDSWEDKSLDGFDVQSDGNSLCVTEGETEEKLVTSASQVVNPVDIDVAGEVEEDGILDSKDACAIEGDRVLREPICCILGHVDAGKTKLLDCIRHTNVQKGEARGITQQIGATYVPVEYIKERAKPREGVVIKVPGLLVIDTPGHESFSNMRSRGMSLCDIAVVVVDIMHGLEKQTVESLALLKDRNVRFIVVLNKVDRLCGWKHCPDAPIKKALENQSGDVKKEFEWRLTKVVTQLKENGFNTALYYDNQKFRKVFDIVPTSAISGEGIPDLLLMLVLRSQATMMEKLTFVNTVECTVLEVNDDKDLGTTIDVVLINGVLHKGDQVNVCTKQGPVATIIRDLLTPHPLKELRVKGIYKHHKELKAAQGVKIVARGLKYAIPGTSLIVVKPGDDLGQSEAKNQRNENEEGNVIQEISRLKTCKEGVYVQASTFGILEAIIEDLNSPGVNVPVSGCNLGPIEKKDVMKASAMLKRKEEYAAILAFNVRVMPEADVLAAESGVKIVTADTVYKLVDSFNEHIKRSKELKKMQCAADAVFPCTLKNLPNRVYRKKDPFLCDVEVLEGVVKVGTPICVYVGGTVHGLGRISSMQTSNGNQIDSAKQGVVVSVKITGESPKEKTRLYGRHFDESNELISQISRRSIDVLKEYYRPVFLCAAEAMRSTTATTNIVNMQPSSR
uniref:Eukaryotic translation initiation factor 5B n=1 Tax=Oryza meridionalis TaxID=40149 RepID=A0A0E0FCA7_9ORYZ